MSLNPRLQPLNVRQQAWTYVVTPEDTETSGKKKIWDLAYSPHIHNLSHLLKHTHRASHQCAQSGLALGSELLTHIVFLLHFPYNLGVGRPPEDALGGESWKTRGPGEPQRSEGWIASLPYQSWSSTKGH